MTSPFGPRKDWNGVTRIMVHVPTDEYDILQTAAPCDSMLDIITQYTLNTLNDYISRHSIVFEPSAIEDALRRLTIADPVRPGRKSNAKSGRTSAHRKVARAAKHASTPSNAGGGETSATQDVVEDRSNLERT